MHGPDASSVPLFAFVAVLSALLSLMFAYGWRKTCGSRPRRAQTLDISGSVAEMRSSSTVHASAWELNDAAQKAASGTLAPLSAPPILYQGGGSSEDNMRL